MTDLRTRILFAEQVTRAAREDIDVWHRRLHAAVRRNVSSPVALVSGAAAGFALGRYRAPTSLEKPLTDTLHRMVHLAGTLGGWSLGYDAIMAAMRPRDPRA